MSQHNYNEQHIQYQRYLRIIRMTLFGNNDALHSIHARCVRWLQFLHSFCLSTSMHNYHCHWRRGQQCGLLPPTDTHELRRVACSGCCAASVGALRGSQLLPLACCRTSRSLRYHLQQLLLSHRPRQLLPPKLPCRAGRPCDEIV